MLYNLTVIGYYVVLEVTQLGWTTVTSTIAHARTHTHIWTADYINTLRRQSKSVLGSTWSASVRVSKWSQREHTPVSSSHACQEPRHPLTLLSPPTLRRVTALSISITSLLNGVIHFSLFLFCVFLTWNKCIDLLQLHSNLWWFSSVQQLCAQNSAAFQERPPRSFP